MARADYRLKTTGSYGITFVFGLVIAFIIILASGTNPKLTVVAIGALGCFAFWAITLNFHGFFSSFSLWGLVVSLSLVVQFHVIYRSDHFGGSVGFRVSLTVLIIILLILAEIWNRPEHWKGLFKIDKAIGLAFLFNLIAALISSLSGQHPLLGLFQISTYLEAFLVFVFLSNFLNTKKRISIFITGIFVTVLLQGVLGIAQSQWPGRFDFTFLGSGEIVEKTIVRGEVSLVEVDTGTTTLQGELIERPTGFLIHPNLYSLFFVLSLPIILAVWLATKRIWLSCMATLTLAVGVAGLYVSFSRIAWVSCLVVALLGMYVFKQFRIQKFKSFQKTMIALACLGLITGLAWKADRIFLRLTENTSDSIDFRTNLNQIAYQIFLDYPLTGVGLNSSIDYVEEYDQSFNSRIKKFPVHNLYLMELCESGALGFLTFLGLVLTITIRCWRCGVTCRDPLFRLITLFGTLGLLAFWVAELSGFTYRIPVITNMLWAQIGFILAVANVDSLGAAETAS